MGKFHHSKKPHGDKKKSSSSRLKYDLTQAGRRKLPEDFCILKITRVSGILSAISSTRSLQKKISARSWTRTRSQELRPLQQFHQCCNSSRKLQERLNRKSQSGRGREDNRSQTSLTQEERHSTSKFSRATVLVLKHTDALINLDMHQFLKSDPFKRLDPETKYRRLRQYFSERWGPHSSLDVAKIKSDLTSMRGDDPGWRKYLQNFNYFVGSLEQTLQRDANDAIIYGPVPAAVYPARRRGV